MWFEAVNKSGFLLWVVIGLRVFLARHEKGKEREEYKGKERELRSQIKTHMIESHDRVTWSIIVCWSTSPFSSLNLEWRYHQFLLLIMIITCNGCNKTFKNSHGLSHHWTSCLAAKEHMIYLAQMCLNLQKVGNKILGPARDTGAGEQQQEVMENVSYTLIYWMI